MIITKKRLKEPEMDDYKIRTTRRFRIIDTLEDMMVHATNFCIMSVLIGGCILFWFGLFESVNYFFDHETLIRVWGQLKEALEEIRQ